MSSPISKSIKDSYNKNSFPTPSPSSLSSSSTSSTISSSSVLFSTRKNSYKSASSPTSPISSSPTSSKNSITNKNNEASDIISKLNNKAKINATKILKQPLSNIAKNLSDLKQKNHKSLKINIKDFHNTYDNSLLTPSSEDMDSSKSQNKLKSVTSKDNKYNNTYKLSPYIITDVDLNNIDFELKKKIKPNLATGN